MCVCVCIHVVLTFSFFERSKTQRFKWFSSFSSPRPFHFKCLMRTFLIEIERSKPNILDYVISKRWISCTIIWLFMRTLTETRDGLVQPCHSKNRRHYQKLWKVILLPLHIQPCLCMNQIVETFVEASSINIEPRPLSLTWHTLLDNRQTCFNCDPITNTH